MLDDLGAFFQTQPRIGQPGPGGGAGGLGMEGTPLFVSLEGSEAYREEVGGGGTSVYGVHSLSSSHNASVRGRGVEVGGRGLSDYEHLKDAVTVDNLTRDLADLNATCKQLQGALEKAMIKAYEEKTLRGTCEDKIQELKKTLEARELELDTLKGTFTHYVDSQATEKALKECNSLLAQTSTDLHSRSQELVDARIRQNTLSAQSERLEAANAQLKLLLQAAQDSIKVMQGASGLVEGVSAHSTTDLPSADAYVREREEQRKAKEREKAETEYTSHAMLIRPLQSQQRVTGFNVGAPPRSSFDQSENASQRPENKTSQSGGWLVQHIQGGGGRESDSGVGGADDEGHRSKSPLRGMEQHHPPPTPSATTHIRVNATPEGGSGRGVGGRKRGGGGGGGGILFWELRTRTYW
jgi:hypothetical protein